MAASGPSITDIKLLFARSGNRCAFPKCTAPVALNETLTGEVCHIKGVRPGSARHDPMQPSEERHQYQNLVLMCPTHHTVIDDDETSYTVERLQQMKREHEQGISPVSDAESSIVAQAFVQNVSSTGQIGGLSAHTVNASTITVHNASPVSQATHSRQIQAIEHLWQVVLALRNEFRLLTFIDTVLLPTEIDAYFKDNDANSIMDAVVEYRDQRLVLRKLASAGADVADKERPFVNHRLWSVFFVIQGLYARTALLLTNSFKERRFVNWRDDGGCEQLLRAVLSAQSIDHLKGLQTHGLQTAIDILERQFLAEAGLNKPQT